MKTRIGGMDDEPAVQGWRAAMGTRVGWSYTKKAYYCVRCKKMCHMTEADALAAQRRMIAEGIKTPPHEAYWCDYAETYHLRRRRTWRGRHGDADRGRHQG